LNDKNFVYRFAMGNGNGMVSFWDITQGNKPDFQLLWASKTEKMTMCVSGIQLSGCQLDNNNRRLFELYGADVSEVVEVPSQKPHPVPTTATGSLLMLSAPAKAVTDPVSAEFEERVTNLTASYEHLIAIYEYLVKKFSQQKSGFEPRLQHFSGVIVDIMQSTPATNLQAHLQTANAFKHYSVFKRDRYYDMLQKLLENKDGHLATSTQTFITYLKQCKEEQKAEANQVKVATAILDLLASIKVGPSGKLKTAAMLSGF